MRDLPTPSSSFDLSNFPASSAHGGVLFFFLFPRGPQANTANITPCTKKVEKTQIAGARIAAAPRLVGYLLTKSVGGKRTNRARDDDDRGIGTRTRRRGAKDTPSLSDNNGSVNTPLAVGEKNIWKAADHFSSSFLDLVVIDRYTPHEGHH